MKTLPLSYVAAAITSTVIICLHPLSAQAQNKPQLSFALGQNSTLQLNATTASDATLSQVQRSDDLRVWYLMSTISGPSTASQTTVPMSEMMRFYRVITSNAAGAPPSVGTNAITISRGQTLILGSANLNTSDSDNTAAQLTYTLSGVTGGRFELVSNPGTAITSFTQANIDAGQVQFVHDGTTNAPAALFSVGDGNYNLIPVAAAFTFNAGGGSTPVLVANSLAVVQGTRVTLSAAHIDATDADTADSGLSYTVSNITAGQFERASAQGTAITSFSKTDLDGRAIQFVHDNSTTAPAYQVSVSDGSGASAPQAAGVTFTHSGTHTPGTEFQNALALVTPGAATHTAVASGKWSDAAVWGGSAPAAGARIIIPTGLAVAVDSVLAPEFETLRVDGMLRFVTNANTQLKVDTIVSTHASRFEVGSAGIPIAASVSALVTFADDGPITDAAGSQISRGAILHGHSVIYGAARTNKVALATHPAAGTSVLQLKTAPSGWQVGDQLIVTGTIPGNPTSDEIRTITAISGTSVTLNQALALNHLAPRADLNVYIANSTRNVVFSSENSTIARRGHIMFMHTLRVDVNHARFYQLGRTDKSRALDDITFDFSGDAPGNESNAPIVFTTTTGARTNIRGRYPIHIHRGGTDPTTTPALIRGSVVFDGPGWGFVMHSAHARFVDNVSYAVAGTGFYSEAGDEVGEMVGNIAIRSVNPSFAFDDEGGSIDPDLGAPQQEFGNDGDGFWLSGHLVAVKNNVSAGSTAHGIIFWGDGLVEADVPRGRASVKVSEIPGGHLIPGRTTIPTWWAPLAEVSGNECYGSSIGFRARYIHAQTYLGEGGSTFHASPPQAYIDTLNPTIERLTVWGNRDGVLLNYCHRVSLKNALIVGIGAPFRPSMGTASTGVGLDQSNDVSRGPGRLENVTIEGFQMGYIAPRHDQWTFDNLVLKNVRDMRFLEPRQGPRTVTMTNITFGSLAGTAVAGNTATRHNIELTANFQALGFQPYWFVMPDRITLDGQGIYYNQHAASFTPLPTQPDPAELLEAIPNTYINQTNQQLHDTFGVSFGGAFHPANAQTVPWLTNGVVGTPAPAPTVFPRLLDMTGEGGSPEPPKGTTTPELTSNRLTVRRGQTVTLMETNFNTTDTDTGIAGLTYTVSSVTRGFFAHRNAPTTAITSFTQAQVNGGVIRFVHDGSTNAPSYNASVSDGTTSTTAAAATVTYSN